MSGCLCCLSGPWCSLPKGLLCWFFYHSSNDIKPFTLHSCTVILLSHSHPKHSEIKEESQLDKGESRAEFPLWDGLTGKKLLVCSFPQSTGLDKMCALTQDRKRCHSWKKAFSLPLQLLPLRQHSRLFEHLLFLQCQEITKTLISPPNQILIFHYAFIWRAEQLTRTHNGKTSKSHILLFFQEARKGGCQVIIFFLSFPFFSIREHQEQFFLHPLSKLEKHTASSL